MAYYERKKITAYYNGRRSRVFVFLLNVENATLEFLGNIPLSQLNSKLLSEFNYIIPDVPDTPDIPEEETYTLNGTYRFKDTDIDLTTDHEINIEFRSTFYAIETQPEYLIYNRILVTKDGISYMDEYDLNSGVVYENGTWVGGFIDNVISIGTPTNVSKEIYDWVTNNTEKIYDGEVVYVSGSALLSNDVNIADETNGVTLLDLVNRDAYPYRVDTGPIMFNSNRVTDVGKLYDGILVTYYGHYYNVNYVQGTSYKTAFTYDTDDKSVTWANEAFRELRFYWGAGEDVSTHFDGTFMSQSFYSWLFEGDNTTSYG